MNQKLKLDLDLQFQLEDFEIDKYKTEFDCTDSDDTETNETNETNETEDNEISVEKNDQSSMFVASRRSAKTIDSKELLLELIELKQNIRMNIYMLGKIKEYLDFESQIKATKNIPNNTHTLFVNKFKTMLTLPDLYLPLYTKKDYDEMLQSINSDRETYNSYREFIKMSKTTPSNNDEK